MIPPYRDKSLSAKQRAWHMKKATKPFILAMGMGALAAVSGIFLLLHVFTLSAESEYYGVAYTADLTPLIVMGASFLILGSVVVFLSGWKLFPLLREAEKAELESLK